MEFPNSKISTPPMAGAINSHMPPRAKPVAKKPKPSPATSNDSEMIDKMIAETNDWRGKVLSTIRRITLSADPQVTEQWKFMGTPVWYCDGMIAVANPHAGKVKWTFALGAKLEDKDKLFNAGLEGNARRAIDIFEGDKLDEKAMLRLVKSAIEFNRAKSEKKSKR
jgi:hypothetical protein